MSHAEDTHDKLDAWWTARYAVLEASVAELKRERETMLRALDGTLDKVKAERDAAHAETRDMQLRLTRVVDGSKVMRDKLATAVEALEKARAGVARYVNAQGRHLYESWRDHLIECCDLRREMSGPYAVVTTLAAIEAGDQGET